MRALGSEAGFFCRPKDLKAAGVPFEKGNLPQHFWDTVTEEVTRFGPNKTVVYT